MAKNNKTDLQGVEKASVLLMSLDEEVTAKVFTLMTEDEIRQISQTMSRLGKIEKTTIDNLLDEFSDEAINNSSVIGDVSSAKKLLTKALGADKVENILGDIAGPTGKDTWDRLNNVNEELLASFLKHEHPQTVALILSKITSAQTAKVLSILPEELALNVIRRMLSLEPVKREVINDVEKILQSEFMSTVANAKKTDTFEIIAEIFNNFDRSTESKFFDLLSKKDPESSERIRELMFTFDDIIKIDNAGIQAIIRIADKTKLPLALKGANANIKELFFTNMSERAGKILKEDIQGLGPVRISEVDEAQLSIVQSAKQLADSGEIIIPDGSEEEEEMIE